MHNDFTLFSRAVPSGKKVMYYYAYDENGKRRGPWTTGQTSRTAAKNYCNLLNRKGKLLPERGNVLTFEEYAEGWWDWDTSPYLKERRKRFDLAPTYAKRGGMITKQQLVPYFGKMNLDGITSEAIEQWFDYMVGEEYKNTYINGNFAILKVMMNWAVRKKIIASDPTKDVSKLKNDRKPIKIITTDEFRALFIKDWRGVWDNDRIACLGNKLAALTGMRAGEVLGLRGEYLFDTHLYLCAQYDKFGYRETKTKFKHNVPLPPRMVEELNELKAINGQGFIFSTNGGASPVNNRYLYDGLLDALEKIGMSEGEIKERGLCFHAWRHFCNTELHKAGLSIQQVQAVTGHKTERMSEWYCHFDPMEFTEVPKVQNDLLGIKSEKPEQSPAVALHIVKTEAQQSA